MIFEWIKVLVSIFVVTVCWIVFDDLIENTLYNLAITLGVNSAVLDPLMFAWRIFPVLFILGMFLYGIVRSQVQEPIGGYY